MTRFLANPGVRYLGTFAIVGLALFSVLATPWAERLFVQPFPQGLGQATEWLVRPFDARVLADGDVLGFNDGRGAVQVLAGCNAGEVCAALQPSSYRRHNLERDRDVTAWIDNHAIVR